MISDNNNQFFLSPEGSERTTRLPRHYENLEMNILKGPFLKMRADFPRPEQDVRGRLRVWLRRHDGDMGLRQSQVSAQVNNAFLGCFMVAAER